MTITTKHKLILASQSPRRKELLEAHGIQFKIHPSSFDESKLPLDQADAYATKLAILKAQEVAPQYPDAWILGADTIVVVDSTILGKPLSMIDAKQMLTNLNNREHKVITGVGLVNQSKDQIISLAVTTFVQFNHLSDAQINWYIQTKEPFDKAGGYGIQGKGAFLVKQINGSYTNVVGLPVSEVIDLLVAQKIIEF